MGNPVSAKRADERAEALRAEIADCRASERRVRANSGNAGHAHHAGTTSAKRLKDWMIWRTYEMSWHLAGFFRLNQEDT